MITTPRLRTTLTLGLLPLLVAGLAACSGTDDAGGTDASGTGSQGSVERQARDFDLALTSCMRDGGFELDDPGTGGAALDLTDVSDPDAYLAALTTCQDDVTAELGERPITDAERRQGEEAAQEFQKIQSCLEDKGVVFPESDSGMVSAPVVPDDIAAACGAEGMFSSGGTE